MEGPSFWTHTLHVKGHSKTPERRGNTRNKEAKTSVNCSDDRRSVHREKVPKGLLLPCIHMQGSKKVPTSSSVYTHARCRQTLRQWFARVPYRLRRYRGDAHCTRPVCHWHLPEHSTCLGGMWCSWECSIQ